MQPLLAWSCADPSRRTAIAAALVRGGLELTETFDDLATLHILEDTRGLLIRNHDDILIQLSASLSPDDIVGLARLGLELTTLWATVRSYEDCETAGVIAANVVSDARHALVPAIFAADAIAVDCPAARVLTSLLVESCNRVASILERVATVERAVTPLPMCANDVIGELTGAMRAITHRRKLVTRLERPLAEVAIERPELERILLTLVANGADASRNSRCIVVSTSSRTVNINDVLAVPTGEWVVIEVADDGECMSDAIRERVLKPLLMPTPSSLSACLGLPSVARATRSAGGHISVDNNGSGTKIGIWLPPANS